MMAYDQSYVPYLPEYWVKFQMDLDGDPCPNPSTFDARINIWAALFQRWTHGDVLGINLSNQSPELIGEIEPIAPLEFDESEFENIDGETNSFLMINLENLRGFLSRWEIPLPARLFPNDYEERTTPPPNTRNAIESMPKYVENNLQEIALAARANGFIGETDLARILASDNQYDDILTELWTRFDLNLRKQIPELSNYDSHVTAWWHILTRWTTGTIAGAHASRPMKLLSVKPGEPGYIELDALKVFLEKWQIPLPQRLYENTQTVKNKPDRKPSARQIAIKNAQEIAKRIWEREKVTTTAMYGRTEIKEAYGDYLPVMKTFRRHMKGLNPNPKPGRPKASNGT